MKAYVTHHAMTSGVRVVEGQRQNGGSLKVPNPSGYGHEWIHSGQWCETEAEALEEVRKMAEAKERSLTRARKKFDGIVAALAAGKLPMAKGAPK